MLQHGRIRKKPPESPTFEALGDQHVMDPEAPTPNRAPTPGLGQVFVDPKTFVFSFFFADFLDIQQDMWMGQHSRFFKMILRNWNWMIY